MLDTRHDEFVVLSNSTVWLYRDIRASRQNDGNTGLTGYSSIQRMDGPLDGRRHRLPHRRANSRHFIKLNKALHGFEQAPREVYFD